MQIISREYHTVLYLVVLTSSQARMYMWVIPPGWGAICDGVNCYIRKCSVVLQIRMKSVSPPLIGNYNNVN